ncbi:hypothetical protein ES705_40515 [subsurface metagenome]
MSTKETVEEFLKEFKQKLKIWDIYFRDERSKNTQTLVDLEILPFERTKIIEKLTYADYCEGPIKDELFGGSDMWIFGKEIKNKEVYIKITLGITNNSVICVSFHISEQRLNYPYKN